MQDIRQKLLATFQIEHRDHVEQIRSLLAMMSQTTGAPSGAGLEEAFRRAHSLKGAARAVDLHPVEGLAHRLETLFSRVRQGTLILDPEAAAVVQQALDASEDCVAAVGGDPPSAEVAAALQALERLLGIDPAESMAAVPPTTQSTSEFQPLETVRITARNLDGMLRSAAAILDETHWQTHITGCLTETVRALEGVEREIQAARRVLAAGRGPEEHGRAKTLLDSVGREAHALVRKASEVRRLQQRTVWATGLLGKRLQQDVWQARMLSADSLLEGYRKLVRDLARDQSKTVEFRASCSGVQADRGVLEALKDPLLHALRNAVSHGIEPPRERAAKGKPPAGLVTLRIEAQGQYLNLTIEDDGRGVDPARIGEVAVRQGILTAAEVSRCSPRDLIRLLFRPGFTTSSSITEFSGRGMGLSVVYESVRRLQGEVELDARDGMGTILRLSVPLSLATHRLLLVTSKGQSFGVPMHAIDRLHRVAIRSIETAEGKPVVCVDGRRIPLFRLHQLLDPAEPAVAPPDQLGVLVLRGRNVSAALAVDRFEREIDAVIQNLGPVVARCDKLAGGIVLEDGRIALVVNPIALLEGAACGQPSSFLKPDGPPRERRVRPSLLVVDDSLTTRTLEKSILEASGYRVRVAVDGQEALWQMRQERPDLVITDLQMPRMDGFELLKTMKEDSNLDRIPVIVVTSLDRGEDRERGLKLGVDAYIVKRKFDQEELLATIRQIL